LQLLRNVHARMRVGHISATVSVCHFRRLPGIGLCGFRSFTGS
jgi:hypothetical protein